MQATDFVFGIILHLGLVIQINVISFYLGTRDIGSGPQFTHDYGFWSNTVYNISAVKLCEYCDSAPKFALCAKSVANVALLILSYWGLILIAALVYKMRGKV